MSLFKGYIKSIDYEIPPEEIMRPSAILQEDLECVYAFYTHWESVSSMILVCKPQKLRS